MKTIGETVKKLRVGAGLTQPELARKAGVGLRFIRELERGKKTVRLDTVNMVLALFGLTVGVQQVERPEPEEGKAL